MQNGSAQLTPWICRRCETVQAHTDGVDLYFGIRKVPANPLRVDWVCTNCKALVRWWREGNLVDIGSEKV